MTKLLPYIYNQQNSIDVFEKTNEFLESNSEIKTKIEKLGWVFHSIGKSIPQTKENFWSGHYFPYVESWNELQISFNLASQGLYKQAYTSLRSALEVGMLSVYYNINDDGHKVVQSWLRSKNSWEANTPRADKIWKILKSNENIAKYNSIYGLEDEFGSLSFLHNYVHTKGYRYSNELGIPKSNFQTFEEDVFLNWLKTYQRIIILLVKLHILKYPISIIEYEWSRKVGIDNPYPVLEIFEIELIKELLSDECINVLKNIAENDKNTQGLFGYICSLPDITDEEEELQIINLDKSMIEHGEGFIEWEKKERERMERYSNETKIKVSNRIEIIRKWAIENNMMKPMQERIKGQGS